MDHLRGQLNAQEYVTSRHIQEMLDERDRRTTRCNELVHGFIAYAAQRGLNIPFDMFLEEQLLMLGRQRLGHPVDSDEDEPSAGPAAGEAQQEAQGHDEAFMESSQHPGAPGEETEHEDPTQAQEHQPPPESEGEQAEQGDPRTSPSTEERRDPPTGGPSQQ